MLWSLRMMRRDPATLSFGLPFLICVLALSGCGGGGGTSGTATPAGTSTQGGGTPATGGTTTPATTPTSAPTAPGTPTATLLANAVQLAFSAPTSTGSSPVLLYTATCTDGTVQFVGMASASPVTVSGLTQSTDYRCTIKASNSETDGPASTALTVNLPAPVALTGTASEPQNLSVAASNGSLTLSFSAPASDGGFPILGYSATCGGAGNASALSSPIIIGGLRNGVAASCTVAALNAQGTGTATAVISDTPTASAGGATAPGAPTGLSATVGNGQLTLAFATPTNSGGSPVTSYTASCTAGTAVTGGASLGSPLTVRGLVNGQAYGCSVQARNAYGAGPATASITATPAATAAATAPAVASLTLGTNVASLAADGITALTVSLRSASGALYAGPDVGVEFSSPCVTAGKATITATATARNGLATVVYQPRGCTGADPITATLTGASIQGRTTLVISASTALSARGALGKQLFFDAGLSASGRVSCASCHSPANGYFSPDASPTPRGGVSGQAVGFRSSPTASYAALAPAFRFLGVTNQQGTVNNGANGKLGTPRGGLMWDGRASDVFQQARGPLTGAVEMANADSAAVLAKLLGRPYLADFIAVFGATTASSNADTVVANIAAAIGQYETEDRSFMAFNSKFDAVQAGLARFSAQEANGQLAFFNANQAACAGCHTPFSQARSAQSPAMFTDGAYRAIGVPRNWSLPYNVDATAASTLSALGLGTFLNGSTLGAPSHDYFDLGFCGPTRTDSLLDPSLCGVFRTPGLRNIALKGTYDHNGVFSSLAQVLDFYLNRDVTPELIYRRADGTADIPFNDLPIQFQGNVVSRPPFRPVPGGRLNPAELQDVITFLCTLTDGYDPANPTGYRPTPECDNAIRR